MSTSFRFKTTDAAKASCSPPGSGGSTGQTSSGSEGDPLCIIDERKRKRMISNRESARRSRMRKQQRLEDLLSQVTLIQTENNHILSKIEVMMQQYQGIEGQNTVLRTQVKELTERLQYLNSLLQFVEDFSGQTVDIPEILDPLLKPWQLSCLSQAIFASADDF